MPRHTNLSTYPPRPLLAGREGAAVRRVAAGQDVVAAARGAGLQPDEVRAMMADGRVGRMLATWRDLLAMAEDRRLLDADDAKEVRAFLDDPEGWSAVHGGKVVA